jgi:hypothetical protein
MNQFGFTEDFLTKLHSLDINQQCAELQTSTGIFLVFLF